MGRCARPDILRRLQRVPPCFACDVRTRKRFAGQCSSAKRRSANGRKASASTRAKAAMRASDPPAAAVSRRRSHRRRRAQAETQMCLPPSAAAARCRWTSRMMERTSTSAGPMTVPQTMTLSPTPPSRLRSSTRKAETVRVVARARSAPTVGGSGRAELRRLVLDGTRAGLKVTRGDLPTVRESRQAHVACLRCIGSGPASTPPTAYCRRGGRRGGRRASQ